MAEENPIGALIERIRAEGQLTRNTGTNSIKVTNEILTRMDTTLKGVANLLGSLDKTLSAQLKLTQERLDDAATDDLLEPKGKPKKKKDDKKDTPPTIQQDTQNTVALFGGLGLIGKAIALAVGGIAGVLTGQWNAIKSVAKLLTPASWGTALTGLRDGINTRIEGLRTAIGERITSVRTAVTNGLTRIGEFLKIDPESNIGKAIARFKSFFSPITALLDEAGQTLKGIASEGGKGPMSKIKNWLNILKGYFTSLGGTVSGIARVVGKIFAPIAIITTAFDTVKGAIDGYAENGILGGLQGAIDGLFTSLITKPLDLLKSAVAWVLDKLGFDSSAEALNSFSFTELWTSMTDKIFAGVQSAIDFVKNLFTFDGETFRAALGLVSKLTDIVYAPINSAINFVRDLFGWSSEDETEPFKLNDYIIEMFNKGIDWAKDALSGVGETIKTKLQELANWITSIPDRVTIEAQIMYENLKAKLQAGFLMFGEWFASIPDKIKLLALETIRSLPGGGLLVGEDDIQEARANVENRGSDIEQRLQAIEDARVARLAELEQQAAALQQSNNNTVVNNGGNSTTQTTNNYYNSSTSSSSLDPSDPRFAGAR